MISSFRTDLSPDLERDDPVEPDFCGTCGEIDCTGHDAEHLPSGCDCPKCQPDMPGNEGALPYSLESEWFI